MRDDELAGVFLQRFTAGLHDPPILGFRDAVARKVRAAASKIIRIHGIA